MSDSTPSDSMTLAGLALANGPWLGVRLQKLAEHAGHPLTEETIESAVSGSSRVLAQVLDAEGRPSANADHTTDPAAQLGREQAQLHQQAGLDMPASLRVLRLMRRAYDDLVRESWVDKDSRSRAHEDVERFFERMLIGHCLTWTGNAATQQPAPAANAADRAETERLAALVAQRESEVRRALDAARMLRERATTLGTELAQAKSWGTAQRAAREALKAELATAKEAQAGTAASELAALKAEFAEAEAQSQMRLSTLVAKVKALETRRMELETRMAEAHSALAAQREVEGAHELALKEIDNARAEADASREELRKLRQQAQEAVDKAESQTLLARREAEIAQSQALADVNHAREELRKAQEAHATLASEAEAMRAHLAETGSRMSSARRAEEAELQARLAEALERVQVLETEAGEAGRTSQTLSERLAEQEGLHAFKDERLREQSRAVAETQELLVSLGAAKKELQAQAQAAETERDRLDAELAALTASSQAGHAALTSELDALRQQLDAAETSRDASQKSVQDLEAERDSLATRLIEKGNSLAEAERQGQDAATARDACASLLSTHLALTEDAVAAVDGRGNITAWNPRFPILFGLTEADQASPLETLLPLLAKHLQRPEAFLARMRKLLADPADSEDGLTLATTTGQTLVFRSHPTANPEGGLEDNDINTGSRLLNFRDVSLEHDMENLVREIEAITRYELGHSLTAFIHLPQELLDDPATTTAQTQKLTVIRDSGYRIVNTVNMAVDIFRMERGLYHMPPGRNLDLAVVARRAAKDVGQLAASRHIDLELLLGDSPLPQDTTLPGPGDTIPAHALVLNLLRDALEAAPRQSSVRASLHLDKKAKLLCLDITRPGTLTPDQLASFFDKPVGKEPGDGLARARYASKLIANTFGGSLNASTSPESTTLSLRLPKA
jgi:hypothetical protein